MNYASALDQVCRCGVIPILVPQELEDLPAVGDALVKGGITVAEVTLRTDVALDALRILAAQPDMIVGAGTVLTAAQVELACAAGARFIVSPGFSRSVVDRCQALGLPVVPGVATATDILSALDRDIRLVKFFPAEASGGLRLLGSLHGPFPDVSFIPTGGLTAAHVATYLSLPYVAAVGGSWMVPPQRIRDGDFDAISRLAAAAVQAVQQARSVME